MSAHTPGPGDWSVKPQGNDGSRYLMERTALGAIRVAKFCGSTALSGFSGAKQPEGMADRMALAVAAPDLLAACEAALEYDRLLQNYARTGKVAVRDDGSGDATGDDLDAAYSKWIDAARAAIARARGGA